MFWNISSFLPHPLLVLPFIWSPGLFQVCYLRSRDQGDTPGLSMAVAFLSSCPSLQVSFLLLWWNSPAKSDLGLFTTPGQSPPLKASLLSFHTAVPFFPSQKHSRNRRKCRLLLGLRASGVSSVSFLEIQDHTPRDGNTHSGLGFAPSINNKNNLSRPPLIRSYGNLI